jgi:hypothetical protein
MAALEQGLADGLNQAGLSDAQESSVREALASALQAATTGIENDRATLHKQQGQQVRASASSIDEAPPDYKGSHPRLPRQQLIKTSGQAALTAS